MRRGLVLLLALVSACAAFAETARPSAMLTGDEIKALFQGNTVSGVYVGGGFFSEFHAPDGRALGDNGHNLNVDACWNTDGDKVCYHYGQKEDRRTYCFTVEKSDDRLILRIAGDGRVNAIGRVDPGNPSTHGDGGRRWSCDDLISRAPGRRLARR